MTLDMIFIPLSHSLSLFDVAYGFAGNQVACLEANGSGFRGGQKNR